MLKRLMALTLTASGVALLTLTTAAAGAEPTLPRQGYTPWQTRSDRAYDYRWFGYRADPASPEYDWHAVVFYRNQPGQVYFFDPQSQQYWARCSLDAPTAACWQEIAAEQRGSRLTEIAADAFAEPVTPPALPGSPDEHPLVPPTTPAPALAGIAPPATLAERLPVPEKVARPTVTPASGGTVPEGQGWVRVGRSSEGITITKGEGPKAPFRFEYQTVFVPRVVRRVNYVPSLIGGRWQQFPVVTREVISVPESRLVRVPND